METQLRNDGSIALFLGATRSGKSVPLKAAVSQHKRAIGFDPKGELASQIGFENITHKHHFLEALMDTKDGDCSFCFTSTDRKDFDFYCDAAFNFNRLKPCAVVTEELAILTNSGKAVGHWGRLTNQGLAFGMTLLATAQKGQDIDKTLLDAATFIHVTRHSTATNKAYIAAKLGIDISLVPNEPLEFLQWSSPKGVVAKGTVQFTGPAHKLWGDKSPVFKNKGKVVKVLPNGGLSKVVYQ